MPSWRPPQDTPGGAPRKSARSPARSGIRSETRNFAVSPKGFRVGLTASVSTRTWTLLRPLGVSEAAATGRSDRVRPGTERQRRSTTISSRSPRAGRVDQVAVGDHDGPPPLTCNQRSEVGTRQTGTGHRREQSGSPRQAAGAAGIGHTRSRNCRPRHRASSIAGLQPRPATHPPVAITGSSVPPGWVYSSSRPPNANAPAPAAPTKPGPRARTARTRRARAARQAAYRKRKAAS
jgi:hypothetical protein